MEIDGGVRVGKDILGINELVLSWKMWNVSGALGTHGQSR